MVADPTSSFSSCKLIIALRFSSYGFCIPTNQYDSVQSRIWRKIDKKDKTESRLAEALLVSES